MLREIEINCRTFMVPWWWAASGLPSCAWIRLRWICRAFRPTQTASHFWRFRRWFRCDCCVERENREANQTILVATVGQLTAQCYTKVSICDELFCNSRTIETIRFSTHWIWLNFVRSFCCVSLTTDVNDGRPFVAFVWSRGVSTAAMCVWKVLKLSLNTNGKITQIICFVNAIFQTRQSSWVWNVFFLNVKWNTKFAERRMKRFEAPSSFVFEWNVEKIVCARRKDL